MWNLPAAAATAPATTDSAASCLRSRIHCAALHRRTNAAAFCSCSQPAHVTPLRSICSPIKAMAESQTISVPKSEHQSSASGKKQALISLSDKKDLEFLGNGLQDLGYTIVSTGGTATALENAGVSVTKVEQLTSFPEMVSWVFFLL